MIRSMLAAISGMRNHQTFLDVVGNNIANVNTTGFKSGRVLFSDLLSQLARGASSPQQGRGGTNPMEIGLGMQVAGVDTVYTQGNLQSTGKFTDLAIQGEGFFILNNGLRNLYSRDGAFDLALDGSIVNPTTGMKVQGWMADANGVVDTTQPLRSVTIPFGASMVAQPSTEVVVRGNLDSRLSLNGSGTVTQSRSSGGAGVVTGTFSGAAITNYTVRIDTVNAGGDVTGASYTTDGGTTWTAVPGAGITVSAGTDTALQLSNGFTITIPNSANNTALDTYSFTATPPVVNATTGIYDSMGTLHNVSLSFRKTGNDTWTWQASSSEPGVTVAPATPTTISFNGSGVYVGLQPAGTIALTLTNGANSPATVDLDLANLSQLAGTGEANAAADGAPAGSLSSFSIGQGGDVVGVYSNGLSTLIGQLGLATFANPGGLMKSGKNLYEMSANSGDAAVGTPGAGGRGEINSGYLEMSNVDLALQFTSMIMAQRGFQANSRVITTSDEMLQDLVNLKR